MKRFLVVANQTAGAPALMTSIKQRLAGGPASFHVVVPATGVRDLVRLAALGCDPLSGYNVSVADVAGGNEQAIAHAQAQLDAQLAELRALGADASGEVGDPDPLTAIADALKDRKVDEILLSTLPAGVSRWLSMDLPHRAGRKFGVPLAVVECSPVKEKEEVVS